MADSWLARMDGEKITPRRVGETGAGDGGGDVALAITPTGATPSDIGHTWLPSSRGGADGWVGVGDAKDSGADVVGGAAIDEVASAVEEDSFKDEEAAMTGRP